MSLTIGQVQLGGYTFTINPKVEEITHELLQSTAQALDGSTLVSYIPQAGDDSKIGVKRAFRISGIDPDVDQVEAIQAELENAPPLPFTDAKGGTWQVVVTGPLAESLDAEQYNVREYDFTVREF